MSYPLLRMDLKGAEYKPGKERRRGLGGAVLEGKLLSLVEIVRSVTRL